MGVEFQLASLVLRRWKKDPNVRRIDLTFWACDKNDPRSYLPLPDEAIASAKRLIREHVPSDYYMIFPEERTVGWVRRIEQFRHYLELMSQRAKDRTDGDCYIVFGQLGSRGDADSDQPSRGEAAKPAMPEKNITESTGTDDRPPESDPANPSEPKQAETEASPVVRRTGGIVIVGTDPPSQSRPACPSAWFLRFTFTRHGFSVDIPESIYSIPGVGGYWRKEPGFYYSTEKRREEHPSLSAEDLNPLRRTYAHGDEQIAAENIAYFFFDLCNVPVEDCFFVNAGTIDGKHSWEDWDPMV